MDLKAIIFDFDGVLVDSVPTKGEAFAELYKPSGEDISRKVYQFHIDNGGMSRFAKLKYFHKEFLNQSPNQEELEKLANKFSSLVVDKVVEANSFPGAIEYIENHLGKTPMFVNSGTPTVELREIIRRRNWNHYFVEVLGSPQNKVDNMHTIMKAHNLTAEQCIFFGDAPKDAQCADETGIRFIGLVPKGKSALLERYPQIKWYHNFIEISSQLQL